MGIPVCGLNGIEPRAAVLPLSAARCKPSRGWAEPGWLDPHGVGRLPRTTPIAPRCAPIALRRTLPATQQEISMDDIRPLAVITGASSGIGLHLALEAASHGYDLILAADEP